MGIGNDNNSIPRKRSVKTVTWISRDQVKIDQCVKDFKTKIGKKVSFKSCMGKIKTSVECTMRKKKKRRKKLKRIRRKKQMKTQNLKRNLQKKTRRKPARRRKMHLRKRNRNSEKYKPHVT